MTTRYKLADNTIVVPGRVFSYQGTWYGADWFRLMTAEQKEEIGLTEIIQDPQPDQRFFYSSEDPSNPGKWLSTPIPIERIKARFIEEINAYVASELAKTDWMHDRAIDDESKPMPADIQRYRNAVRDQGNALVLDVEAIDDFDDLIDWQQHDWPKAPRV